MRSKKLTEEDFTSFLRKLKHEIVRLNTLYQRDYDSPKFWAMTEANAMKISFPTDEQITERHIGAITLIRQINDFIGKELKEIEKTDLT